MYDLNSLAWEFLGQRLPPIMLALGQQLHSLDLDPGPSGCADVVLLHLHQIVSHSITGYGIQVTSECQDLCIKLCRPRLRPCIAGLGFLGQRLLL